MDQQYKQVWYKETLENNHEQQAWKNLQKLYPHVWSNKHIFFAFFLGTILGIILEMIFSIG